MTYRREIDLLGEREVPGDALWGIHTLRAMENFPIAKRPVHPGLIHAFGMVKLAAARTNHELGWWDEAKFAALETACLEMSEGKLDEHILVDALQGGAGTSTNMNVNEVLANRALQLLGQAAGRLSNGQSARRRQSASIDQRHLSHRAESRRDFRPPRVGTQSRRAAWKPSSGRKRNSPTW